LGKPRGSDERHGKRTYVSEFGIERARELAGESHRMAREALAEVASRFSARAGAPEHATTELEGIADFIYTRTS
jgi:geranylgeranyl diphosphate synthase type II